MRILLVAIPLLAATGSFAHAAQYQPPARLDRAQVRAAIKKLREGQLIAPSTSNELQQVLPSGERVLMRMDPLPEVYARPAHDLTRRGTGYQLSVLGKETANGGIVVLNARERQQVRRAMGTFGPGRDPLTPTTYLFFGKVGTQQIKHERSKLLGQHEEEWYLAEEANEK